jgi:hypothetical protein
MSSINIEAMHSSAEIIQNASSFLAKYNHPEPYLTALVEGFAEEVANGHKGASVNLTILHPSAPKNGIDMGEVRFDGHTRNGDGKWEADFFLEPEGISCPVGVEYILVR